MSVKLKSQTQAPPGGFQYVQRETGWNNTKAEPSSQWDIRLLARKLQEHRRANHSRFAYLSLDYTTILNEVDAVNAARVAKMPGAEVYIIREEDANAANPKFGALPSLSQKLKSVVEGLSKVNAGRIMLLEWENQGYPQVPQEQANSRAGTCADCPRNGQGDFTRWFTVPASDRIKKQIERLKETKLETPNDAQLGICEICLCPLKLKAWTPLDFIRTYLSPEIKGELSQVRTRSGKQCWVITEGA